MSSATISVIIAFFSIPDLILQCCCYYCFSLALLITGFHIVFMADEVIRSKLPRNSFSDVLKDTFHSG